MQFNYNDGGRAAAGYKGHTGDCVCRAICIATGLPYQEVYDKLAQGNAAQRRSKNQRGGKFSNKNQRTAARGIYTGRKWFKDYMASLGFTWVPCMLIGQGCKVHLTDGELPMGRLVVAVSKHLTAVIDGVINDTYNPSERGGTIYSAGYPSDELPKGAVKMDNGQYSYAPDRCVYGYYILNQPSHAK